MLNPLAADLGHVLAHTSGVWDELREARLFITGGTGFFGCWLLETFAWACDTLGLNATATVLTRSPEDFAAKAPHLANHPSIRLHRGHIQWFEYPDGKFTHVIHAATEASAILNRERPLLMLDTIVDGTRRVLDFAVTAGVERCLLISSGAVYGTQPATVSHISEEHRGGPDVTDPHWVYGEGKRLSELLAAVYAKEYKLKCPIARPFAFTGPYLPLNTHFAIGNFISDSLENRRIEIHGDGTPFRSYLYAADLAIWLWTMLVRGQSCRAYNIGSEEAISIGELAGRVNAALNSRSEIVIAQQPRPGAAAERYVPSTARAQLELGLRQTVPLDEAIRRTAAHAASCVAGGLR